MKEVTKFSLSQFADLPNPGLRTYLNRVKLGSDEEFRTTFYKGKSLQSILSPWMETLKSRLEYPELLAYEEEMAQKVGPLSIQKPISERLQDIEDYYTHVENAGDPIDDVAIAATINEFSKAKGIRVKSLPRTWEDMKKSTNSGLPFFTKKSQVAEITLDGTINVNLQPFSVTTRQKGKSFTSAAVIGWRGQEGGPDFDDVKQRVVWMFPFIVNIHELSVYQPLITACQKNKLVPAWISLDEVDATITRLFDTKRESDLVICTDFSKFDQHFNVNLQNSAKSVLTALLTEGAHSSWLKYIFPIKFNIPLLVQDDLLYTGPHGMGSGSGGTNADETLAHRSLQHEVAIRNGGTLNPNSQCLGDDGILTYPGITVDQVMQAYTSHGLEMNQSKQYASTHDCVYLRRWHDSSYRINNVCVGVYSTCRALGKLAEQERWFDDWSKEMVALRQLSIIENCKYHPLREEFADYCMKGDKYRLGLDIPGFLDNITTIARQSTSNMSGFMGYVQSLGYDIADPSQGIASWWIVNYLKSKA